MIMRALFIPTQAIPTTFPAFNRSIVLKYVNHPCAGGYGRLRRGEFSFSGTAAPPEKGSTPM